MANELKDKKVAILMADEGVEQIELTSPREALEEAGASVELIAPGGGEIQAFNHYDKGDTFTADRSVSEADASDYDSLFLPGGAANGDELRTEDEALEFVREFFKAGKPVGVICHGPWTLIDADVVEGRAITSFPSIQTDLKNAGAKWVDKEVCTDQGLVSSRGPDDLDAFNAKLIEEIGEGVHQQQKRSVA